MGGVGVREGGKPMAAVTGTGVSWAGEGVERRGKGKGEDRPLDC
jgi:hypothetical protein